MPESDDTLNYLYNRRERLDIDRAALINSIDRYLFTVSTGALAAMLTFLNTIHKPQSLWLVISMAFFALTIISILICTYLSSQASAKEVNNLDSKIKSHINNEEPLNLISKKRWNIFISITNIATYLFFVVAISTPAIFYIM